MGLFGKKRTEQPAPAVGAVTLERAIEVCRQAGLRVDPMTTGGHLVEVNGLQIVMAQAHNHLALGTFFLAGEGENYAPASRSTSDWVIEHNNGNNGPVAFITEQTYEGAMRVILHCEYRILDGLELSDAQFRDEVLYGLDGVSRGIWQFVEFKDSWG
ncbi:hypothetical protein SAMN04488539_1870 [Corynebacterium timonense]|uniref:Uncharacterized protein n=2 Tax=Corynebacterium timonense TaxID=441500 RepID=A0A1H1T0M0_9CORY|nr:hypothetical protein SAMN04488539_1870 [Corynebacterium timonense]